MEKTGSDKPQQPTAAEPEGMIQSPSTVPGGEWHLVGGELKYFVKATAPWTHEQAIQETGLPAEVKPFGKSS